MSTIEKLCTQEQESISFWFGFLYFLFFISHFLKELKNIFLQGGGKFVKIAGDLQIKTSQHFFYYDKYFATPLDDFRSCAVTCCILLRFFVANNINFSLRLFFYFS